MLGLLRLKYQTRGDRSSQEKETAFCPYCGGHSPALVSSTDRNRHTTDQVFDYFQCSPCGLVFMDPIPADLGPFYQGGYQEIPQDFAELRRLASEQRYRMDPILRFKQKGKLLEIGPWIGMFSSNARDAGFDVTAIEMDPRCVDFLNATVGIRALQSDDPAAVLETMQEQFDVIALWHSVEHLRTPWVVLQKAAERLAPGGILLIATPNIESYEFSLLRAAWMNLDTPRHLYFYPVSSLIALCRRYGLEKLHVTTNDELSDAFSLGTWARLASSITRMRYLRWALRRTFKHLANRRERKEDSGPNITAVFQRPQQNTAEGSTQTLSNAQL